MIKIPAYDYKCDNCNVVFEFEHPMSETMDYEYCPSELCSGYLHKVFRPAAVTFKGSGWGKVYGTYKPKNT